MSSGKEYIYKLAKTKKPYHFEEGREYQLIDKEWKLDPKGGTPNYVYFENFSVNKPPKDIPSVNSIYKFHCGIDSTHSRNMQKAVGIFLTLVEETELPIFCKITAPETAPPRKGAEITIYPPACTQFKSNEEAAAQWIAFIDQLAERLLEGNIKPSTPSESDRPANMYVSYRVGKSGAGIGRTMDLCGQTNFGSYCNYAPYEALEELAQQGILTKDTFYNPPVYVQEKDGSYNNGYIIGRKTELKQKVSKEDLVALPDTLGLVLEKQKRQEVWQTPFSLEKGEGKVIDPSRENIQYKDAIAILKTSYTEEKHAKKALKLLVQEHHSHKWRNHIRREDVEKALQDTSRSPI